MQFVERDAGHGRRAADAQHRRVIGEARVTGGAGLYLGTFAGALFLSALSTVITALSLSQGFRDLIQGGIILIALLLQSGRLIVPSR
jgi:ribose transport system permease protein